MKRIRTKNNSLVAKTLATSMLFASCVPNTELDQIMEGQFGSSSEEDIANSKGVPISLFLNEETKQSLREIAPLVQEIIANPQIAQELSKDPEAFCKQRGYKFTIDLDDAIFKVIVALGNSEINEALKNNDFERFMQLCAEMKLLDEGQKIKLNTVFQSEEEQEIFNSIAYELNGETIETRSVAFWFAVSVVLIVAIILTYTVGMEERLVPDKLVQSYPDIDGELKEGAVTSQTPNKRQAFLHCTDPNYSVLDVWALKNKNVNSYQLVSGYKVFFANQLVSYLKINKPNLFEKYSDVQISEFLKKNMIV